MDFSDTLNNLVVGNNLTSNLNLRTAYSEPGGINFNSASNNTIYHQLRDSSWRTGEGSYYGFINAWDDAYPFGGNYWSY